MARIQSWSFVVSMGVLLMLSTQISAHSFQLKFESHRHHQQQQQQQPTVDSKMDELWSSFKETFNKNYAGDVEDSYRRSIWLDNVARVQTHNLQADIGQHTYTLGINEYSDLTMDEYRTMLLGTRVPANYTATSTNVAQDSVSSDDESVDTYDYGDYLIDREYGDDLPDTVDWRTQGYVTPVKNQGSCGSCWAFSSTGSLEGQNFKKNGKLVSLSEQDLVDCTLVCGNNGCGGGWMTWAFKCVKDQGGIDTEDSYPYQGVDNTCRFKTSTVGAKVTGYTSLPVGDEKALQKAVATIGPISVAIDANHPEFFQYKSGVLDMPECTSNVDHGVLVVGYGTLNGQDYWLVKNSWGTSWGMNGYVMMSRNKDNQCAIANYAVYPNV